MNGLIPTERKAVAPIIATLLMVAIAVVGGILIFVFTQGFFTETDTGSQNRDKIEIVGYDLRDVDDATGLQDHTGNAFVDSFTEPDDDGDLRATDVGVIYVTNNGDTSAVIRSIEVGGSSYGYTATDQVAVATGIAAASPGDGTFMICSSDAGTGCTTAGDLEGTVAKVAAGDTVSLIFQVDAQQVAIKNGRSTKITVETDNGGIATVGAKVGKQRGS